MIYNVRYSRENYIKDNRNYLKYFRKKPLFNTLMIFVLVVIMYQCVSLFYKNEVVLTILFSIGFTSFFFFLIEIYIIIINLYKINKSAKSIVERVENIVFEPTVINFSDGVHSFPVFKSQIKECLIIKDTLFIVMKKKKTWPARINKSEVGEREFELILNEFRNNKIKVTEVK
ncbi:hypothetical protein EV197_2569 [Aquimarina brevivitae]|uniref:YcxB-like protein n=1 Tax=Aquimarina brevivitae TaxID=323412 RepID=A0A4Q7P2X9_9FLAO|nr:hypothetical protein EV197_2569 [Aquimarina brevivitae]